jgi:hypothetical protein
MKKTTEESTTEDGAMRRTHLSVAAVGIAFALCGLSFFGAFTGVSVLAGAVIATLNLLVLSRTVHRMVAGGGASWAGVALIKFLVLMAVTYGLIHNHLVQPLALAVGFGALPFGILIASAVGPAAVIDPNVESDHA